MILNLIIALVLTLIIELFVVFVFYFRMKYSSPQFRRIVQAAILVNVITNPLLNYFLNVGSYIGLIDITIGLILFCELIVILVEWGLLYFALRRNIWEMFFLSLAMNGVSYLTGGFLFGFTP